MFWKRRDWTGARVGQWKWTVMTDKQGRKTGGLFDLATDSGETTDLSAEKPEILEMVQARFQNWLREMEAAEPRGPFRDF